MCLLFSALVCKTCTLVLSFYLSRIVSWVRSALLRHMPEYNLPSTCRIRSFSTSLIFPCSMLISSTGSVVVRQLAPRDSVEWPHLPFYVCVYIVLYKEQTCRLRQNEAIQCLLFVSLANFTGDASSMQNVSKAWQVLVRDNVMQVA